MRITKLALALSALLASPVAAQDGTNVLVVVNSASPSGQQIAEGYAAARSIPADNVVRIATALTEDIERERYELQREIEHLRAYEREYRARLKNYFQSQLDQLAANEQQPAESSLVSGSGEPGRRSRTDDL